MINEVFKLLMIVYVGDGFDGGFNLVYVSLCVKYFGKLNFYDCF